MYHATELWRSLANDIPLVTEFLLSVKRVAVVGNVVG